MIEPGCYPNLSNEEYHGAKEYVSRSGIMDFDRNPYNYWAKHLNPDRPKRDATPAMILGSAFHIYCLEDSKFWETYDVKLEHFTKKHLIELHGKEKGEFLFFDQKITESVMKKGNKTIISHDDYHHMKKMLDNITMNHKAIELLRDARIENSFFWQDKESGLLLKARPDILQPNMIIDLKTTSDASPRAFQNEMVKYGYHVQFAMIRDAVEAVEGHRINSFINIVIETKYPYSMGIYMIDEEAVDEGERKYKEICFEMIEAFKTNKYKDYGVQTISLPKWAF